MARNQLAPRWHWKLQPLATVDAAGAQNVWYTILDTKKNVRFLSLAIKQVNDEAANKSITVRATIDGISIPATGTTDAVSGSFYPRYLDTTTDRLRGSGAGVILLAGYYVAAHGRTLKVEISNTSAAGTNQHLYGYVRYMTKELIQL